MGSVAVERRIVSHRVILAALLSSAIVGLPGCGGKLPPLPTIESLDAWRAYSDALEPRLSSLVSRDSTWAMGDASSNYTVWWSDSGALAVHEKMSLGDYGERRLRYYLAGGFIRYVREEGRILAGGAGTAELRSLEREVLFATDGQVLVSSNRVGGAEVALDAAVATGLREHGLSLAAVDVARQAE